MRDPTVEELAMPMQMGFDALFTTAALQMANYNAERAIEILLGGQEGQILEFSARQRTLKEAEEERQQKEEMELALKMSMQAEGVQDDAQ